LLGIVTGYYFGRAPAERQAQQAVSNGEKIHAMYAQAQQQLFDQQDKMNAAYAAAQLAHQAAERAQSQADAIKAEVTRELASLANSRKQKKTQARVAALLDWVNRIA
jgi:transglutaminase-like putative cysteine protease